MAYHLVRRVPGPAWDHSRGIREQRGWDEHAAFMDRLTEHRIVVLGGPVGRAGDGAMLVMAAYDAAAVHALLAADPWSHELLTTASVEPWTIWLRAPETEPLLAG